MGANPQHLDMIGLKGWTTWLVVLLAIEAALCGDDKVIKRDKPCPTGCTDRGNCNSETGKCECAWGYTGPSCEVDQMAACRQTPNDPGSCGNLWPKHCDCYRECHRLYCRDPNAPTSCAHEIGYDLVTNTRCWRHNDADAPPSSLLPDRLRSETTWYRHFKMEDREYDKDLQAPSELWGVSNWPEGQVVEPLSSCPDRCSDGRGVCLRWSAADKATCWCHKGYNGSSCAQVDPHEACWFSPDCGGRGVCRSAFCHCTPGFFGVGCHRSRGYQPATPGEVPDVRSQTRFKIYMYDLPWDIAFPFDYNDGHFGRDGMYKAYEYFMQYFLTDNAIRTENPYEANLFYIPMLLYFYVGNVKDPVPQATRVLDYIAAEFPFYNRSGGRDHFYFMTGDRGTCTIPRWMQDRSIKVVHFGMQRTDLGWLATHNKEYGCVQMKRDLVVPPINSFNKLLPVDTVDYYKWLVSNNGYDGNRSTLFFFAGGLGHDLEYSGGARQAIMDLLAANKDPPSDVKFLVGSTSSYRQMLMTSKFCLAPYGYGWGLRLVQAIEFGCIPIIIQDHVYQAFEDFMPYEDFSVRMPVKSIPHMVELLRAYSEEQMAALRLGLARYYRAFIWHREWGGTAYEWTLAGLQRRAHNLGAEYFSRHRRRGG